MLLDFVKTHFFEVICFTVVIFYLGRSFFNSFLKELYIFITLLISFMVAWNFHETKFGVIEQVGFTMKNGKLMLLCFIFVVLQILFGAFKTVLFANGPKFSILTIPLKLIVSFLSALVWINLIYIVISLYFPSLSIQLSSSKISHFAQLLFTNMQALYQTFFSFF